MLHLTKKENTKQAIESLKIYFKFLESCWESETCSFEQKENLSKAMSYINENILKIKEI